MSIKAGEHVWLAEINCDKVIAADVFASRNSARIFVYDLIAKYYDSTTIQWYEGETGGTAKVLRCTGEFTYSLIEVKP